MEDLLIYIFFFVRVESRKPYTFIIYFSLFNFSFFSIFCHDTHMEDLLIYFFFVRQTTHRCIFSIYSFFLPRGFSLLWVFRSTSTPVKKWLSLLSLLLLLSCAVVVAVSNSSSNPFIYRITRKKT